MARNKKPLPILEHVTICDVAAEGNAIAKIDNLVIFVPYGAPGDIVDLKLEKKRKSYANAHIEKMIEPSAIRLQPFCSHFGICGGCKWQHLPYEFQLEMKGKQVKDAFERIGHLEHPEIPLPLGSKQIREYRNKLEFTYSNKSWLTREQLESGEVFTSRDAAGFHIPGAFDKVLDIEKCYLQNDISNQLRKFIKNFGIKNGYTFYDLKNNSGFLRTLMVRTSSTGQTMALMSFGENRPEEIYKLMSAVKDEFPELTSLLYVVNTKANDTIGDLDVKCFNGSEFIEEEMEGLRFRIGPKSFYQTNSLQAYELYKVARDFANLTGNEIVYDLYTGTGTIANFVSRQAKKVVGIEYVPEAIEDAKINSERNGIKNTVFYAGDMKDVLSTDFIAENGKPDVVIVDPPRAGMHPDVVDVLLQTEAPRMVYVSCNPATQARDLALLSEKYKITKVQPVDMFPHTHHIENVVALELIK